MTFKARRKLRNWISILVIICILGNMLPPPVQAAPPPFSPDYTENLLAVSGTLEQDDEGNLRFPYPESLPGSARGVTSPYADLVNEMLDLAPLPDPPQSLPLISGQSSRLNVMPEMQPASFIARPTPPASATSLQLTITGYPGPLPLQSPTLITNSQIFLPFVTNGGPQPSVVGEKAIFNVLLDDVSRLSAELGFSEAQVRQIQAVVDAENAALASLEAEAKAIIDANVTLEEKRAAISTMDYTGQLNKVLRDSQTQLENQLGQEAYIQFVNWLNKQWQLFVAQRNAIRSTSGNMTLAARNTISGTCQVFDLFATRSTYTDYSADLPDQYVKFANRGIRYEEGYTNTIVYSITVKYNTTIISNVVITDVAPHNHNDNYWNSVTDTIHPRRVFTDLLQGMPEAEAAYFTGYNGGLSEFNVPVTTPAGLNVSGPVADLLGIGGSAWVEVTFPWGCIPDDQITESRLERSWGVNNIWTQYSAHLVNAVTGNQALWFRDLRIPAPGLPVDLVRYYNSQDGADGIFGRGWSSQFDMRVYPQADGSYKVRYEDGRRGIFRPDGSSGFVGDPGVFDTFALEGGGFVLTTTERIAHRFDSNGRLQTIRDLVNNQISLVYTSNNPTKIIDSVGREINLTFDANGHVTRIEDPGGRVISYTYGTTTRAPLVLGIEPGKARNVQAMATSAPLMGVTNANGGTTSYGYDPTTQALSRATDPDDITFVENLYDAQGRVRQQSSASGNSTFEYDLENLRAISTDQLGNQTIYVFDKKFRLVEEIDPLGHSMRYKYDDQDNMIEKTDKRGNTWKFDYDERGNMTRREDLVDAYSAPYYSTDITTWEYNERNQVVKMTNALGEETHYEYDGDGNLTKVTEANGVTTTSAFNSQGQMTSMTDAEARTTYFEYDAHGNRNKIIDPNGGITLIEYDDVGRVISRTNAEGHTTRYEYDGNDNVTKIIDPLGGVIHREYDGNNMLVKQIDRRGTVFQFKYDGDLNQIEQIDPLGNITQYEYDAMHNRTKMIAPNGNITTYGYDPLYRVITMTDPAGYTTLYEYDENGNMTKAIDAIGGETEFIYDALNRRKFVKDALGFSTEFCYDPLDRATCVINARGAQTDYEYDPVGNLRQIRDPLDQITTMGYDLVRNQIAITDANGHATHYAYDRLNRLVTETDPLEHEVHTGYDKVGNTIAITDANGNLTTFDYNANNWLVRSINALGKSSAFTYDAEGSLITTIDENGHRSFTHYDLLGRPVGVTDEMGFTTGLEYDANGNQTALIDANGNETRYIYDIRDLLVKEIDPLGNVTIYEYDGLKRLVRTRDAHDKPTTYAYDAISRLTAVADASGQVYQYEYDAIGNQTLLRDSNGQETRFEYNLRDELIEEVNSLDKTWAYHYDPVGNLLLKIDGNLQAIRYDYDAANRLVRTSYPDGKAVVYDYDPNGNQIHMADWNGTLTETYDALNRRTSATDYKGRTIAYNYDDASNLTELIYPDGKTARYDYNARYQLETMTDPAGLVTSYSYDPVGLLTGQVRPNDTRTDLAYDQANRLTSLRNTGPGGDVVANFEFTLDGVGNRVRMIETRSGIAPITYDYAYDEIYQLVGVTSDQGQAIDYAYDPVGNRASVQGIPKQLPTISPGDPISTTYEYDDLNALLQAGNTTFDYDRNGNRVRMVQPISETKYAGSVGRGLLITDYVYDAENRLVTTREIISHETVSNNQVISGQAVVMEAGYSYDGMGRRVAKLVQTYNLSGRLIEALLREYVYNGLDVVAEYEYVNGATAPDTTHYYYGNGEKVAMERLPDKGSARTYWYAYDAVGTTAALLDENGLAVAEYHHDEYGRLILGDSLLNRYLFTGQEYDPETGLVHFFARYYDSNTGVWLTQDIERGEAQSPATLHRYAYVLNNPINRIDPLGYWSWPSWEDVTNFANDVGDFVNDKIVEPVNEYVVKPAVETVNDVKELVDNEVVQPVVNRVSETVQWVDDNVIQPAKEKTTEVVNYVNENYVQPAIEQAKETLENTREALTKAADWIQEHKMEVAAGVGFVAGLAVGFVAAGVFCAATAGIGCAIIAGAAAGLIAGGLAAGGTQMFANIFDSSAETGLFDNVLQAVGIGGVTGAIGGGIGGAIQFALSGGSSASNFGSRITNIGKNCRNSFSEGTPVATHVGSIPIEDVDLDDKLLAYDEKTGETSFYPVTFITSHVAETVLEISVGDNVIRTTRDHPIWVYGKGWTDAEDIVVGDKLKQANGELVQVQMIENVSTSTRVFNFTVDSVHTYFITDDKYLVHNTPQCPIDLISKGQQYKGKFPANSTSKYLYRLDSSGQVTNYARYNKVGEVIKRVDYIGRSHNGVPTPHVHRAIWNTVEETGKRFFNGWESPFPL